MIKVVIVAKDYRGGTKTFIDQILNLDKRKYDIYCIYYKRDYFGKYASNSIFLNDNYPDRQEFSIYKTLIFISNFFKTIRLIKKINPDIVISFPIYSFVLISIAKLFFRDFKNIINVNSNIMAIIKDKPGGLYRYLLNLILKLSVMQADFLVSVSKYMKNDLISQYGISKNRVIVIPNSVDINEVAILAKKNNLQNKVKLLLSKNKFNVFTISRLEVQKDIITLLKAFKIVLTKKPDCQLFIIGDGPLRNEFEKFCKLNGLRHRVSFLGWKDNVFEFLTYADIFVFSSKFEGFPFSIIEAMATGVPVIATDTPYGPREILDNGKYGLLAPMKDPEKMAQAIIKLAKSKRLRKKYKNLGLQRVKKYDTKIMIEKFNKLFLEVTK